MREAFRALGFDAYSNDMIPARDESPFHLEMDVYEAIQVDDWGLIIMFPPCDHLTIAGNRWYGFGQEHFDKRLATVDWTLGLWDLACHRCDHVAMENPKGILPMNASQYIQPHQFGHPELKLTGLWLHGLPDLRPTNELPVPLCPEEKKNWEVVWRMPPSPLRKRMRSETKVGVAKAMAEQWGDYISAPTGGHSSHQLRIEG